MSTSEVSGYLVGSAAFKAVGTGDPRPAGSSPVHLRQSTPGHGALLRSRSAPWSRIGVALVGRAQPAESCDRCVRSGSRSHSESRYVLHVGPVFVSHSSADGDLAERLVRHLEARGIRCWFASRDVDAGDDYTSQIVRAIESCSFFVVLVSAEAESSPHVRIEIDRAISLRRPRIPVRIDGVVVGEASSYLLAGAQWIDLSSSNPDPAIGEVERVIQHGPTGLERRPEVPFSEILSTRTSDVGIKVSHPVATIALVCSFTLVLSPIGFVLGLVYLLTPGHRPEGRLAAGSAVLIGLVGTAVLVGIAVAFAASQSS